MSADNWLVVRKSRTVIGGYRVVAYGLSEAHAERLAASYKSPHHAMPEPELLRLRLQALDRRPVEGRATPCEICGKSDRTVSAHGWHDDGDPMLTCADCGPAGELEGKA
jgi:hypothetical protein